MQRIKCEKQIIKVGFIGSRSKSQAHEVESNSQILHTNLWTLCLGPYELNSSAHKNEPIVIIDVVMPIIYFHHNDVSIWDLSITNTFS